MTRTPRRQRADCNSERRVVDIELIILAAVAVFVLSRLHSVLGEKTGAETPPANLQKPSPSQKSDEDQLSPEEREQRLRPAFTGPAAAGLEAIAAKDNQFDPEQFTRGARGAYSMIVGAFADGDRDKLRDMVDDDVYEVYVDAIEERERSETEPMRLLRIKSARIVEASLDEENIARVDVSFESELGDGEFTRKAQEIWTFKRSVEASDPNWILDEVNVAS